MTEQKLKELLADMTLEEKVNQMSQVVGAFFNKDMDITAMGRWQIKALRRKM